MTTFAEYLRHPPASEDDSIDQALARFLPLLREVLATHADGLVAPLDGLDHLHVDQPAGQHVDQRVVWFEEAQRRQPRANPESLRRIGAGLSTQERDPAELIGDTQGKLTSPVYLPGYVCWEHRLGHHDPLTDIYCLGLILASLACGLNLENPQDLRAFVAHRGRLSDLKRDLPPVVARVIERMTELDRHRRLQDLPAVLRILESYRQYEADGESDPCELDGAAADEPSHRQRRILAKLRERLFELSRRNRLLQFRATQQSLNLTLASVPIGPPRIGSPPTTSPVPEAEPRRIATWTPELHKQVAAGKTVALAPLLNFAEALYLPDALDKILAETRRDQKEFGFAQLRLVPCFLRWTNLKAQPVERYESPLVLIPVQLIKRKGISDAYSLEIVSTEAEVNPVVRFQFKQLYDIDLPETLDLTATDLDAFFAQLSDEVARSTATSAATVTLRKIDQPAIWALQDRARRKLDQYRRRARLAGGGPRSYGDLAYSYDAANYHPLGIKLFAAKIRPPSDTWRDGPSLLAGAPPGWHAQSMDAMGVASRCDSSTPFTSMFRACHPTAIPAGVAATQAGVPQRETARDDASGDLASAEQASADQASPNVWTFDLCNVTLANLKYRKMSLVRDYEALLGETPENPAFEAAFSLAPRATENGHAPLPPPKDRFHVVSCDPTQATAIAEAQAGRSYIIQGPPGTGKSQTITNLIADYVARGQRVLFVCEKRAALDVVFARLRQCGLDELCCLIHDSQADKKAFVLDLKRTYESFLDEADGAADAEKRRKEILKRLNDELKALEQFSAAMQGVPDQAGVSLRQLLRRCIELREQLPRLTAVEKERLPPYRKWWENRERLAALADRLTEIQGHGILAAHPLRLLSPELLRSARPLEQLATSLDAAANLLASFQRRIAGSTLLSEHCTSLATAARMAEYAHEVLPLAKSRQMCLLAAEGQWWRQMAGDLDHLWRLEANVAAAAEHTKYWRRKLGREELAVALRQSRVFDGSSLAWLKPAWWRLRRLLRRAYDFKSHGLSSGAEPPGWTQILEALDREHAAAAEVDRYVQTIAEKHGLPGDARQTIDRVLAVREAAKSYPSWLAEFHGSLVASDCSGEAVEVLLAAEGTVAALDEKLAGVLCDYRDQPLGRLARDLAHLHNHLDDLPDYLQCLADLSALPAELSQVLRTVGWGPQQLEAAIADRTLEEEFRARRQVGRFDGERRARHVERLEAIYDEWLAGNAATVRQRVRERFLEHVRASSATAAGSNGSKEFKQRFVRGRRELEHEFGKSMRYRSIRDLVASDTGEVVKDLKPVWLMSPLSVSDTLPLDPDHFDVVIFDEASQITLEEAIPSLFRARQAIVVGDEMQLPPTDFFSARRDGGEDDEEDFGLQTSDFGLQTSAAACSLMSEACQPLRLDLDSNSFLNHAAKNLPSTMLGWHYRSRSESLISFSNWAFYDGRLLTVPEQQLASQARPPLRAKKPSDAGAAAAAVLERPISFHLLERAVYEKRRNRAEAEYIAQLVRSLLSSRHTPCAVSSDGTRSVPATAADSPSIGIVAFSEAQQDEIESALQRLSQQDSAFRTLLDAEWEREENGQFVGLLVKNLENIQGDERDIVILSVCYGYGPGGKMLMNFGPINKTGGQKRLNVAFSRAKRQMVVVSSITHADITNDYNDGANCLKSYLRYAEAVSCGDQASAGLVLRSIAPPLAGRRGEGAADDAVLDQIAAALTQAGYEVDRRVGQSHFRCDLAVRKAGDTAYRLGILLDGDDYYAQADILERDLLRPRLLRTFGWRTTQVLAKDWYNDAEGVVKGLVAMLEGDTTRQLAPKVNGKRR